MSELFSDIKYIVINKNSYIDITWIVTADKLNKQNGQNLFEHKGEPSSKAKYNIYKRQRISTVKERFEIVVL